MAIQDIERQGLSAALRQRGSAHGWRLACFFFAAFGMVSGSLCVAVSDALAAEQPRREATAGGAPTKAGAGLDLAQGLAELQRQKKPGVTFSSGFQTRFFAARTQKTRESRGTVMYLPPQKFKWEVTSPEAEIYVSSGEVLWKYSPAAKHASRMAAQDAGLEFLQALTDPKALQQRYSLAAWESDSGKETAKPAKNATDFDVLPTSATKNPSGRGKLLAKLTPKLEGTPEEFLYLVADRTSGQVDEIRIAFRNGNRNVITFEKWSEVTPAAAVFEFTPPPGTAVDKL